MPQPFKPKRIEVFSEGAKVVEYEAQDFCSSLGYSISAEESPTAQADCGIREMSCPPGWGLFKVQIGNCPPGCWRYVGGNAGACGQKGWQYRSASYSGAVIPQRQYRYIVVVRENSQEVRQWTSRWFCASTPDQQLEYEAARPTVTESPTEWCPDNHLRCGDPCADPPEEDWCCLDCAAFKAKIRQLKEAAEAVKDKILGS